MQQAKYANRKRASIRKLVRRAQWISRCSVVQSYPWFKFYFPLFLGVVMYDNEFKTKKNKM